MALRHYASAPGGPILLPGVPQTLLASPPVSTTGKPVTLLASVDLTTAPALVNAGVDIWFEVDGGAVALAPFGDERSCPATPYHATLSASITIPLGAGPHTFAFRARANPAYPNPVTTGTTTFTVIEHLVP